MLTRKDGSTESAAALRGFLGSPRDWLPHRPRLRVPRPGLRHVGPVAVFATSLLAWPAFAGATGDEGNVAFGLYIGAVSIMLMAWSFILALRLRRLEPLFGGLDKMYRVHRWAGSLAVVAMWLHTRAEPEIEGGIRGASRGIASLAQSLAGQGETLLYVLVLLSLVRLFPYRWWRWTHKLMGIPFIFASWHFFTAEKPYANGSGWGWWFGAFMVAGIAAFLLRVGVRDTVARGVPYRVVSVDHSGSPTELLLEPKGRRRVRHHPGQFAFIRLNVDGLEEPHPFSIASPPGDRRLRFLIRDLGDWTQRLRVADLLGASVAVEGPYGRFKLRSGRKPAVWIAGGVGITPFLSGIGEQPEGAPVPHLFYAVRSRADAPALEELEMAERQGRLHLHLYPSAAGHRLTADHLRAEIGHLGSHHVAMCGPAGLMAAMEDAVLSRGADQVHREDFDMRGGVGPERSREIDAAAAALRGR